MEADLRCNEYYVEQISIPRRLVNKEMFHIVSFNVILQNIYNILKITQLTIGLKVIKCLVTSPVIL